MRAPTFLDVAEQDSLVFRNASWEFYDMFTEALGERPSRVSFDGRTMEMAMTLSFEHEGLKSFIGELASATARELRIAIVRGGSTTLKFKKKKKGLEPDHCYWVRNAAIVRGVKRLDLKIHPPPDLVVEIDVTHSAVNREDIYLAMGVPEMWHYARAGGFTGWRNETGEWRRIERSVAFPALSLTDVAGYVDRFVAAEPEDELLEAFRSQLRRLRRSRRGR